MPLSILRHIIIIIIITTYYNWEAKKCSFKGSRTRERTVVFSREMDAKSKSNWCLSRFMFYSVLQLHHNTSSFSDVLQILQDWCCWKDSEPSVVQVWLATGGRADSQTLTALGGFNKLLMQTSSYCNFLQNITLWRFLICTTLFDFENVSAPLLLSLLLSLLRTTPSPLISALGVRDS
jgi:hypothetical protein